MIEQAKIDEVVQALNAAMTGLRPTEAAALLCGIAAEAAVVASGARAAAQEFYLTALELARRAGVDKDETMPKSSLAH